MSTFYTTETRILIFALGFALLWSLVIKFPQKLTAWSQRNFVAHVCFSINLTFFCSFCVAESYVFVNRLQSYTWSACLKRPRKWLLLIQFFQGPRILQNKVNRTFFHQSITITLVNFSWKSASVVCFGRVSLQKYQNKVSHVARQGRRFPVSLLALESLDCLDSCVLYAK